MLRAKSLSGLAASWCLASTIVVGCSAPSENSSPNSPETGGAGAAGGAGGSSAGTGSSSGTGGSTGGGSTATAPDGYLEPCESDEDCRAFSLLCDEAQGCVQCLEASTCPSSTKGEATCTAGLCGTAASCVTSLECPQDLLCDTGTSRCVACLTAGDCDDDEICVASACEPQTGCEEPSSCPSGQVCNLTSGSCVECVDGTDCASGSCMNDTCVTPECLTEEDCGEAEDCKDSECVPAPLTCEGTPKVTLLLARSGGMFELPSPGANWWTAVRAALLEGDQPLVEAYDSRLDLGVRVFHRETSANPDAEACPLALEAESGAGESDLADLFDDAEADHEAAVEAEIKIDAPLPETIASAAEALGSSGRRVLVVVTTGLPDSCSVIDSLCAMDPSVAAVQAARARGVEVYVLGLGENPNVDWDFTVAPPVKYTGFLAALANAGAGEGVSGPPSIECTEPNSGEYSATGGDAPYFHALDTAAVASELDALFQALVDACE